MIIRPPLSLILTMNVVFFLVFQSKKLVDAHSIIDDTLLLDRTLGDYALRSYTNLPKTGFVYSLSLPTNLSGVRADMVRLRCGSLRRYGTNVKEFHLGTGISVQPCLERVVLVRQNLGLNLSKVYYENYNVSGYQLVSPVLGLLAYDPTNLNTTNLAHEVEIFAEKKPIIIDFSNVTRTLMTRVGTKLLCASFGDDGKVNIYDQISSGICLSVRNGHFGLVIEKSPLTTSKEGELSEWKIILGSSVGGVLGVFLLGLLFIAMFVKVKKRSQMVEMERKAYEEEALQIAMVGHVKMPKAPPTRTQPSLEHEYSPP